MWRSPMPTLTSWLVWTREETCTCGTWTERLRYQRYSRILQVRIVSCVCVHACVCVHVFVCMCVCEQENNTSASKFYEVQCVYTIVWHYIHVYVYVGTMCPIQIGLLILCLVNVQPLNGWEFIVLGTNSDVCTIRARTLQFYIFLEVRVRAQCV